ncbi:MAG TPA: acetate--CoA ligase [Planctomycetes bacterium]|nr:acetate--CoA ligase [Planctomycetota bacterium]
MSYGHNDQTILPDPNFSKKAHVSSMEQYQELYQRSIENPEAFWAEQAKRIQWRKEPTKILDWDFHEPRIRWFEDGSLNVTESCLDRHVLGGKGDKTAILWEGNDPKDVKAISYKELLAEVCRFSHVLKNLGVQKGDRVCFYMPMIPELAIAMLACARVGAIHSIVFGGFSSDSLRDRILDSESKVLITADGTYRGTKEISLKKISDEAVAETPCVDHVVVFKNNNAAVEMVEGRDHWAHDLLAAEGVSDEFEAVEMNAEDPLFILYTSGSTGRPKGVLHTCGGYLVYTSYTHEMVFDHRDEDIYWCTADIGWITGHSYIVYGPLANGATTLMFEGVPTWPDAGRFWDVVERHKVSLFYTAPTAIRALRAAGDEFVTKYDRSSLRLLGTVGEPINPEAWEWYYRVVGESRCPIVDTWWQTETGGILISGLPGATPMKPGSASFPLPGVKPSLVDEEGNPIEGNGVQGMLCMDAPWPGMMRTLYKDPERFKEAYFSRFPGRYFTGDGCRRDEDGYYWIIGRVDDVLNVSGHRIGTAEVESALVKNHACAEAAVVGCPHEIKGEGIYAYVIPTAGYELNEELKKDLIATVRKEIGPFAAPEFIHFTPGLPKTRSGKIMRRILRKIARGETQDLGDTTTLADPEVVDKLIRSMPK